MPIPDGMTAGDVESTVMQSPEAQARVVIDAIPRQTGWVVQEANRGNLAAGRGMAFREFPLKSGYGCADYLLFVDQQAMGVIEAKRAGTTLTGVEVQSQKYSEGLPDYLSIPIRPLPFRYESTGVETRFTCGLGPEPRSRRVFHVHRPETFALGLAAAGELGPGPGPTLRARLRRLQPLITTGLWPAQIQAVQNLERSLANDRPRALIQMATGSGKTFTAITAIYRLIKFANVPRVLFLVDRAHLGRQALEEFQQYVTPDDGRKFTELYNVQHLTSNTFDRVARVCITTIQRLYSMLQGEAEFDAAGEEASQFDSAADLMRTPMPVTYNPAIPIETFDLIVTDECHRSI
jgi:type I restriction enzyme R subunit